MMSVRPLMSSGITADGPIKFKAKLLMPDQVDLLYTLLATLY